ncbi:hypothetical protein BJ165DRAFT_1134679 [Panaeolus papilionaceus]|nr:hypothetical protein BJ165DRAFT_1134679 [Panaeolus papilionaceus]
MAPLAGKPPFATDEPDSYYESSSSSPQRRVRPPPPDNPNKRTSAYNVYDNYIEGDASKLSAPSNNGGGNRNSGIGAMLMNLGDDSDEDDSDDDDANPFSSRAAKPTPPSTLSPSAVPSTPTSKHAALAAAIAPSSSSAPRPSQEQQPRPSTSSQNPNNPFNSPPRGASSGAQIPVPMNPPVPMPPQMNQAQNGMPPSILQRPPPGPQPIAAPRPGYPAPIAALNLARPEPIATRGPQNPFDSPAASPMRPHFAMPPPGSPAPSAATPHPLLPPVTPITPVFIKPAIPAPQSIKFEDGVATPRPAKVIMRGDREETLLPSRGEKGDDFWRRFSIVAKEENRKPNALKESSWLKKMQTQGNKHSRSVWIVGIILIVLIAGGVGFGVWATRNSPDNQAPTILGGSDGKATAASAVASSTSVAGKGGAAAGAGGPSTVLHVTPTFTVDRREEPVPTAVRREVPVGHRVQKRRLDW